MHTTSPSESPRRVLLCSTCVPWPDRPRQCRFHIDQALALRELGTEMHIFSPAPRIPRLLAHVSSRAAAHARRPTTYDIEGIRIDSPRTWFAFPSKIRFDAAQRRPSLVAKYATRTIGGALARKIEDFQPDLLLGHGCMPWGHLLRSHGDRYGLPFAIIEHSAEDILRLRRDTPLEVYYRTVAEAASAIMVVGDNQLVHLQSLGYQNVVRIPNGATPPSLVDATKEQSAESRDSMLLLAASNYYRRKGLEELIRAFGEVAEKTADVELVIITSPSASLSAELEASPARERIRLLAPMPRDELLQWMTLADLFVLPSRAEAFGLVYVEALSCGTPVVMSADCGLANDLDLATRNPSEAQHGWIAKPGSVADLSGTLLDAIQHRHLLPGMGRAGRTAVASKFTWTANATAFLQAVRRPSLRSGDRPSSLDLEQSR